MSFTSSHSKHTIGWGNQSNEENIAKNAGLMTRTNICVIVEEEGLEDIKGGRKHIQKDNDDWYSL